MDVERIASVGWQSVSLATTPLELIVGLYFLWKLLGVSALFGLVASIIAAPVTYYLGTVSADLEDRIQSARDKRVGVISEMLLSIKMIKFNAWESRARERVEQVRQEELKGIAAEFAIGLLMYVVTSISLALMGVFALGHYTLARGEALTPSIAFSALAILEGLQYTTSDIPDEIVAVLQAAVSFLRTARYLQSEEIIPVPGSRFSSDGQTPQTVALSEVTVTWPVDGVVEAKAGSDPAVEAGNTSFTLTDLNVTFAVGQLNLIVGRLGSGKSLLLKALLGEAQILSGLVLSPRSSPTALAEDRLRLVRPFQSSVWQDVSRVAYVPQTTYLQSSTIRANILFGLPLWDERYQETLDACGLRPDVTAFDDGDLTLVGENGVTLSGGQKARVSLARAIYSRASTLLLDDCLSAVDAETAAHIYEKLFKGPLCCGRTVILVSHQVQLVAPAAAKVVVIHEGSVAFDGDSQAFLASKWSDVAREDESKETVGEEEQTVETLLATEAKPSEEQAAGSGSSKDAGSANAFTTQVASETPAIRGNTPEEEDTALKVEPKTAQEETRSFGSIPMHVYWTWLRAGSSAIFWLFVASLFILSSWSAVFTNVWLKWWMQQSSAIETGRAAHSTAWWYGWYSAISLGSVLLIALRKALVYYGTIKSSRALFRQMTNAVLRAPLGFHNACPQGRLLNRFGSDFETVDVSVPYQAAWFLPSVLAIFLNLGAAVLSGGASSLLPVLLVVPAYVWYGRLYCTASRDARRLAMLAYSKVMSSVAEMVAATPVIRAFGASEYLRRAFFDVYDDWLMAKLPAATISHYVSLRLELLGSLLTFLVSALIVLDPGSAWGHTFNAATAGFLLTTIHNVQEAMERTLYSYASLERSLVSVERVIEYTKLPSEAAEIVEPRPHASWPSRGRIDFVNVAARYAADLPLVLKNISFSLPASSKIAIVGSTGSGKSTLVQSLFRLIEADAGEILIDGINVGKIGLQDLRSRLQIVPQDPIILAGSLRSAVDVLGTCKDEEVLAALRAVALIREDVEQSSAVPLPTSNYSTDFSNLSYPISEGGSNLSAGEKQLICLARCILSQSKVIVLDEATSSTDAETEAIVSQSVHKVFTQSTVIAIAHRLRSIIDFDKVLVIEEGEVAEFDSPASLLAKGEESKFYRLCQATGDAEFAYLKDRA
ncbi:P-loop containing nucleoside triphosphate hydrolase protein, partial [Microstroma glucosiphilum]